MNKRKRKKKRKHRTPSPWKRAVPSFSSRTDFHVPFHLMRTDSTEGWNRWTEHSISIFRNFRISPQPTHAHHPTTMYSAAHHFADTNSHTPLQEAILDFFSLRFHTEFCRTQTNEQRSIDRTTPFSSVSSFDEWSVKKIVHITNWVLHPFEGKTFIETNFIRQKRKEIKSKLNFPSQIVVVGEWIV